MSTVDAAAPHPRLAARKAQGPHTIAKELNGFNGWLAVLITNSVGTMWCAYAFAILALISLPEAIKAGTAALIAWIAQTFLQLVLLSIIMVGQKVAAAASDKQAYQTYEDAEALLTISNDIHQLIRTNDELTEQIHTVLDCGAKQAASVAATGPTSAKAAPPKATPAKSAAPKTAPAKVVSSAKNTPAKSTAAKPTASKAAPKK
jgi:hypothetical protein